MSQPYRNADITQFANHFKPFQTYLLSVVRVKESTYEYAASFNNSPGQSIKMLFLNQLKKSAPPESPLPPPARLVVTPFDAFDQQAKDAEFGTYKIVITIFSAIMLNSLITISNYMQMFLRY